MIPLHEYKKLAHALAAERDHAKRSLKDERRVLKRARGRVETTAKARDVIQAVAQQMQDKVHGQIAAVVTKCLKAVFGEDSYEFVIRFEKKRGKTEARFLFRRVGMDVYVSPDGWIGGGVVDVAAFALRLACLLLSIPRRRRLLILDEPFRMVSSNYAPRVKSLLETLSADLGLQIVQVTHSRELIAGKVIQIGDQ